MTDDRTPAYWAGYFSENVRSLLRAIDSGDAGALDSARYAAEKGLVQFDADQNHERH